MAMPDSPRGTEYETFVDAEGNVVVPADRLHVAAGTPVRVEVRVVRQGRKSFRGVLTGWPHLEWDDFARASELAQHDVLAKPADE